MAFRFPYLALDLETTGLDRQQSHVLQLAAIYDDGGPLAELPVFNVIIKHYVITYGEAYAMDINRNLLRAAFKAEDSGLGKLVSEIYDARAEFEEFLYKVQPEGKITVAGKNVGGFDVPILNNPKNAFTDATRRFLHRTLDPGSMFTDEFDHIPNLDEINQLTGREPVTHDAVNDCLDVVFAVRYKWGV